MGNNRKANIGKIKAIGVFITAIMLLGVLCAALFGCQNKTQTYTLYIDANGGSFANGVTQQEVVYEVGEPLGILNVTAPTRPGHTFNGYSLSKTDMQAVNYETPRTETLTIYANWKIRTYTVSFEGEGIDIEPMLVNYNDLCTPPATPIREGYTFNGWRKGSVSGTNFDFTKDKVISDTTLYASWIETTYKVTFDTRGGANVSDVHVKHGKTFNQPITTKLGYTFTEWRYGFEVYDFTKPVVSNLQLTAVWRANTYSLSFDLKGGKLNNSDTAADISCTYDTKFKLPETAPVRTGYTFLGYSINGTLYQANADAINLTSADGGKVNAEAMWEAVNHTLTVTAQDGITVTDGSGNALQSSFIYNDYVTVVVKFNRGYTQAYFAKNLAMHIEEGSTSRTLGRNVESDDDMAKTYTYNFYMPDSSVTLTLDEVLRNRYTVSYEFSSGTATLNNGVPINTDQTFQVTHGASLNNYTVTRVGYDFTRWYEYYNSELHSTNLQNLTGTVTPDDTALDYALTSIRYVAQFTAIKYGTQSITASAIVVDQDNSDPLTIGVGESSNHLRLNYETDVIYDSTFSFRVRPNLVDDVYVGDVSNATAEVVYVPALSGNAFDYANPVTVTCEGVYNSNSNSIVFTTSLVMKGQVQGITIGNVKYATFKVTASGLKPESHYEPIVYDVPYNSAVKSANGGNNVFANNPEEVPGYEFKYWTKNGVRVTDWGAEVVHKDVTYSAVFEPINFVVNFNFDGGNYPEGYTFTADGVDYGTAEHPLPVSGSNIFNYLSSIPLGKLEKVGYIFTGWTVKVGSGAEENRTAETLIPPRLTTDSSTVVNVTATFEPIKYTVSFYAGTQSQLDNNITPHVRYIEGTGEDVAGVTLSHDKSFHTSDEISFIDEYKLLDNNIANAHLIYRAGSSTKNDVTYMLAGWRLGDTDRVMKLGDSVSGLATEDGEEVKLYAVWQRVFSTVTVKYTTYGPRSAANTTGTIVNEYTYYLEQFGKVTFDDTESASYSGYQYSGDDAASSVTVYTSLNIKTLIGSEISIRGNHLEEVSFDNFDGGDKTTLYEGDIASAVDNAYCTVADGVAHFKQYNTTVDFNVSYLENTYTVNYYDGSIKGSEAPQTTGGIYNDDTKSYTYTAKFFDDGTGSIVDLKYDGAGAEGKTKIICKYKTLTFQMLTLPLADGVGGPDTSKRLTDAYGNITGTVDLVDANGKVYDIVISWMTRGSVNVDVSFGVQGASTIRVTVERYSVLKDNRTFVEKFTDTARNVTSRGYVFGGWYIVDNTAEDNGKSNIVTTERLGLLDETITTAERAITFAVLWKPVTYSLEFYNNGTRLSNYDSTAEFYDVRDLPILGDTNTMLFAGWKRRVTDEVFAKGEAVSELTEEDGAIVAFDAQWTAKSVTLTYDGANGVYVLDGFSGGSMFVANGYGKSVTISGRFTSGYTQSLSVLRDSGVSFTLGGVSGTAAATVNGSVFSFVLPIEFINSGMADQLELTAELKISNEFSLNTYEITIKDYANQSVILNTTTKNTKVTHGHPLTDATDLYNKTESERPYYINVIGYCDAYGNAITPANVVATTDTVIYAVLRNVEYSMKFAFDNLVSTVTVKVGEGAARQVFPNVAINGLNYGNVVTFTVTLANTSNKSTPTLNIAYNSGITRTDTVDFTMGGEYTFTVLGGANLSLSDLALNTYTITYTNNNNKLESYSLTHGQSHMLIAKPNDAETSKNNVFKGWKAGTSTYAAGYNISSVESDIDFVASWSSKDVVASYDGEGKYTISGYSSDGTYTYPGYGATYEVTVTLTDAYSAWIDSIDQITVTLSDGINSKDYTLSVVKLEGGKSFTFPLELAWGNQNASDDVLNATLTIDTSAWEINKYEVKFFNKSESTTLIWSKAAIPHGTPLSEVITEYESNHKAYYLTAAYYASTTATNSISYSTMSVNGAAEYYISFRNVTYSLHFEVDTSYIESVTVSVNGNAVTYTGSFTLSGRVYGDLIIVTPKIKEGATTTTPKLKILHNSVNAADITLPENTSFTFSVEYNADISFADIDIRKFDVSYDGGASTEYVYGQSVTLASAPINPDNTLGFDGWNDGSGSLRAAGTVITLTGGNAKDYAFTAVWTKKDIMLYYAENEVYTLDFTENYEVGGATYKSKLFTDAFGSPITIKMTFSEAYSANVSLNSLSVRLGSYAFDTLGITEKDGNSITFNLTFSATTSANMITEQFSVVTPLNKNAYSVEILDKSAGSSRHNLTSVTYGTTLADIRAIFENHSSVNYYEKVNGYYLKDANEEDAYTQLEDNYEIKSNVTLYADIVKRDYTISIAFNTGNVTKVALYQNESHLAESNNGTFEYTTAHYGESYKVRITLADGKDGTNVKMLVRYTASGLPGNPISITDGNTFILTDYFTQSVELSFTGFAGVQHSLNYIMGNNEKGVEVKAYQLGAIDFGTTVTVAQVPTRTNVKDFADWQDLAFEGWKMKTGQDDEGNIILSDKTYMPGETFEITTGIPKEILFYAVWTAKDVNITTKVHDAFTVTGKYDGGAEYTFANLSTVTVVDGNDKTLTLTVKVGSAYTQAYDALLSGGKQITYTYNGTEHVVSITDTSANGERSFTFDISLEFAEDPDGYDYDLEFNIVAVLAKNTYTFKVFDGNDGGNEIAEYTATVTDGEEYSKYVDAYLNDVKAYYKVSAGFFTRTVQQPEGDGESTVTETEITDFTKAFTSGLDLYFKWSYDSYDFTANFDSNLIAVDSVDGASNIDTTYSAEYNTPVTVNVTVNADAAKQAAPNMFVTYLFEELPTAFDVTGMTQTDGGYVLTVAYNNGAYTFNLMYGAVISFDVTKKETIVVSYDSQNDYYDIEGFAADGSKSVEYANTSTVEFVLAFSEGYTQNDALAGTNVNVTVTRVLNGISYPEVKECALTSGGDGKIIVSVPFNYTNDLESGIYVRLEIDASVFAINTYKVEFTDGTPNNAALSDLTIAKVNHDSTYNLPAAPTVAGYTGSRIFLGWKLGETIYPPQSTVTGGIKADTVYAAAWKEETVRITYDAESAVGYTLDGFTDGALEVLNNGNATIRIALKDGYKIAENTGITNISVTFNGSTATYSVSVADNVITFVLPISVSGNLIDGDASTVREEALTINHNFIIQKFTVSVKHDTNVLEKATVNYGGDYALPNEPQVANYSGVRIFRGWYLDENRSCVSAGTVISNITADFDIVAVWEEEDVIVTVGETSAFTATITKKGGVATTNSVTVKNGDTVTIVFTFAEGYTYHLNSLVEIELGFNGNTHSVALSSGEINLDNSTVTIDFVVSIASNSALDGQESTVISETLSVMTSLPIQTFTVTVNNADDALIDTATVEYNTAYTLPEMPTVDGYTGIRIFKGWYLSESKPCEAAGAEVAAVKADFTIKAVWEEEDVTVTVSDSAAYTAAVAPATVKNGEVVTVTLTFKDGYKHHLTDELNSVNVTFNGKTHAGVTATVDSAASTLKFGFAASVTSGENLDGNVDTVITEELAITTAFPIELFTVKIINANGENPSSTYTSVEYGSALSALCASFENANLGYKVEYYADSDCLTTVLNPANITFPSDALNLVNGEYVVYAKLMFDVILHNEDNDSVKTWNNVVYGTVLSALIDEYMAGESEDDIKAYDYTFEDSTNVAVDSTAELTSAFDFYVVKALKKYDVKIVNADDTTRVETFAVEYGKTLDTATAKYEAEKLDCTFVYYDTEACEGTALVVGSVIITPESVTMDGDVYTIYVKITVNVSFEAIGITQTVKVSVGYNATLADALVLAEAEYAQVGYNVINLYAEYVAEGSNTPIADASSILITEAVTYYAEVELIKFSVTLAVNPEGEVDKVEVLNDIPYGTVLEDLLNDLINTSYKGYTVSKVSYSADTSDTAIDASQETVTQNNNSYKVQLSKIRFDVTLNIVGSSGITTPIVISAAYGDTLSSVLDGASQFTGYNLTVYETYADGGENTPIADTSAVTLTAAATYYVDAVLKTLTVTFNAVGVDGVTPIQVVVNYGASISDAVTALENSGETALEGYTLGALYTSYTDEVANEPVSDRTEAINADATFFIEFVAQGGEQPVE